MLTIRDMQTDGVRGILRLQQAAQSSGLSMDKAVAGLARLIWAQQPQPKGLTIADLPEPKPVHPARLLAELAEEFDRGIE